MKCGLATLLCLAALAALAQDRPRAVLPGAVPWTPGPVPGLQAAWLIGADGRPGAYAVRVKLAPGTRIPPHTHPDERISLVFSGTLFVGFGETVDEAAMVAIPAGAMYVAPAGVPHYVWARDGAVEYQEMGVGPTATRILGK